MAVSGQFAVERGGQIDTREELIAALAIASELEHALLIQYLYAAYSTKKWPREGVSEEQIERIRHWEQLVLEVAHDEMIHLATVCKLSVAVGGAPHLTPVPFPQQAGDRFPFEMALQPFGLEALERFVRYETPAGQAVEGFGIAPDMPEYEYLGQLYGQIATAFDALGDAAIVGPPGLRGEEDWGIRRSIGPVHTAADARAAIQLITEEGEGSQGPGGSATSHYERFKRTRDELAAELARDSRFEPARHVVENPVTKVDRQAVGTLLPEGPVRDLAELFNHVYTTVLLLIGQFYSPVDERETHRVAIRDSARRAMSGIVRPLAETLTETQLTEGGEERAGAPYETYAPLELGVSAYSRFAVLEERVRLEVAACSSLADALGHERLRFLAENLGLLRAELVKIANVG